MNSFKPNHENQRPALGRRRARGFTLIEVLVIVTILGIIAAVIAPQFLKRTGQAKTGVAKQQLAVIEQQINLFHLDHERLPNSLDELVTQPGDVDPAKWEASLKEKELIDPWDEPYGYRYPGDNAVFDLYSYGADTQPGGEGENEDVTNW
jgi:general secretion pathway protein G